MEIERRERKRERKGQEGVYMVEGDTSEEAGWRTFVCCSLWLSFGFVHSSFSVVAELCFMAAGASALREKG